MRLLALLFLLLPHSGVILGQPGSSCFTLSYAQTADFSLLTSQDAARIYFVGESHNVGSNDLMDYSLLTYLNREQAITYFIREGTYSYTFLLGKYLETADSYYLNLLGEDFSVREEKELLDQLIRYNASQPASLQIRIFGIDAAPFYHVSQLVAALRYQRPSPPAPVEEAFQLLSAYQNSTWSYNLSKTARKEIKAITEQVARLMEQHDSLFAAYLQEDLVHLQMVVYNAATFKRSDGNLLTNFEQLARLTGATRFYFSYGSLHARKSKGWLADRINQSAAFRGQVISIKTLYYTSSYWWAGQSRPLNSLETIAAPERDQLLQVWNDCAEDFALISSSGLTFAKDYDWLLLCKNQQPITFLRED